MQAVKKREAEISIKYIFTLLLGVSLHAAVLSNEVDIFSRKTNATTLEKTDLASLYMYSGEWKKASLIWNELYRMQQDSYYLFFQALCTSINEPADASILWKSYIDNSAKEGPEWTKFAKDILEILQDEAIEDDELFRKQLTKLYLGQGYFTALALIALHEKYRGADINLAELAADIYYRAEYYDQALWRYRILYETTGEDRLAMQYARVLFKTEDFTGCAEALEKIKDSSITSSPAWYYLRGICAVKSSDLQTYKICLAALELCHAQGRDDKLLQKLRNAGP